MSAFYFIALTVAFLAVCSLVGVVLAIGIFKIWSGEK